MDRYTFVFRYACCAACVLLYRQRRLHFTIADSSLPAAAESYITLKMYLRSSAFSFCAVCMLTCGAAGADYNGALGSNSSSWQSSPRKVGPQLSAALEAAGGPVAVAAGGTFAAALTASGRVLVWGKLAGGSPSAPGLTAAAAAAAASSGDEGDPAGMMFADVCLPDGVRVSSIAAGQQHLLLSDGQHVWVLGRWVDADGEQVGVAHWRHPQLVLSLTGSEGVTRVTAGLHSSAVVTSDGRLWMWGRLVDKQHGVGVLRRFGADDPQQQQQQQWLGASGGRADWGWSGFGGSEPQLVREVSGVRDVALGGWHALVVAN
jgi:alpha-tubulin suppressor-like RCC1 family protein